MDLDLSLVLGLSSFCGIFCCSISFGTVGLMVLSFLPLELLIGLAPRNKI